MPRAAASLALLLVLAATAPTALGGPAEDYTASAAAFKVERGESAAPAAELAAADEFAARAASALKAGDAARAVRLLREARRALPPPTTDLPAGVARVFGAARFRHGDRVTGMAFAPDGRRLATASRDGTVKVWDLDNGRELLTYRGHAGDPPDATNVLVAPAVAFSPDGKSVASSGGKTLHLWDAATGELKRKFVGHTGPARGLAFTPDGLSIVSGGDDRTVRVWDAATGKLRVTYPAQSNRVEGVAASAGKGPARLVASVNASGELLAYPYADEPRAQLIGATVTDGGAAALAVAFVGDTPNLLTGGGDGRVKLTVGPVPGAATPGVGTTQRTFTGHTGPVQSLSATPDGRRFVTGGADRTVRVWETATGKSLAVFTSAALPGINELREAGVTAVAVAPAGDYVAAGTVEGTLQLWPVETDDESRRTADAAGPLWATAVSPSGKTTAAAGADKSVRVYDSATGKLDRTLTGHTAAPDALAYAGETLLASGGGDKLVKLWDTAAGTATDLAGHTSTVLALAADPQAGRVYSGSLDRTVRAWGRAGKPLWTWDAGSAVTALAARPDGRRLAVGTADGTLTILDPTPEGGPRRVGATVGHTSGVSAAAFSPDGAKLLTCGGDGIARLWTLADDGPPAVSGRLEPGTSAAPAAPPPPGRPAPAPVAPAAPALAAAAFSRDGTLFALGGADGVARLWSAESLREVRGFRGPTDWVTGVAFAADGGGLLAASADGTLRRFDVPRAEAAAGRGHTGPTQCLAVSPDGKLLATGGRDSLIKVWSLADGKLLHTLVGSAAAVNAMAFPSNDTLATTGSDSLVRWWAVAGSNAGKELRSAPTVPGQYNFSLHADKAGRVAVVGSALASQTSTFVLFAADGTPAGRAVETGSVPNCANVSPDLRLVATGGKDGVLRLYDLAAGTRLGPDWPLGAVTVADLAFSPDGARLFVADTTGALRVATIDSRAVGDPVPAHPAPKGVVVAPAGNRFGVFCADGTVMTFDLDGKPLKTWKLPVAATSLTFTPAGQPAVGLSDGSALLLK